MIDDDLRVANILTFNAWSTQAATVEDGQLWGAVAAQGSMGKLIPGWDKWRWWGEGQVRFFLMI